MERGHSATSATETGLTSLIFLVLAACFQEKSLLEPVLLSSLSLLHQLLEIHKGRVEAALSQSKPGKLDVSGTTDYATMLSNAVYY